MILHYLAVVFVWIGSESFMGYEDDLLPWQMANDDFKDYTPYRLYIFSVYWVCTIVTTVGYGDYTGGTTLEYIYTMFIEFAGIVVFAQV